MLPAKRASGGALRRAGGAASTPCLGRMGLGSPPIAGVRGGGLRALQRRRHDVSADAARQHAGHVTMTRDCDRDRCFCSLFQAGLPAVLALLDFRTDESGDHVCTFDHRARGTKRP